ncbi:unnamed protein product, partial [Mesorhabditis spiculigera]
MGDFASLFVFIIVFPLVLSSFLKYQPGACVDGVHNLLRIDSTEDVTLPIQLRDVQILFYDIYNKTSCHEGRPNLKMPGYVKFIAGEMHVFRHIENFDQIDVQPTISFMHLFLCRGGISPVPMFPNRFCNFKLSKYIPEHYTDILRNQGVHTIGEMMTKSNFTEVLELPPSVSFFGVTLLRMIRDRYHSEVRMAIEEKPILHIKIPSDGGYFYVGY